MGNDVEGDAGVEDAPVVESVAAESEVDQKFAKAIAQLKTSFDVQEREAPVDGSPYDPLQLTRRGRTKVEGMGIQVSDLQNYVLRKREGRTKEDMRKDLARRQEQEAANQAALVRSDAARRLADQVRRIAG